MDLFINSIAGHWASFQSLANMNNAAVNILIQIDLSIHCCAAFSSLVWGNVLNDLVLLYWAFLKLWKGGADRGTIDREGKPISRVHVNSRENHCSSKHGGWSNIVDLPSGAWLVSLKSSVSASAAGRLSN